jgi:hypothetical protein
MVLKSMLQLVIAPHRCDGVHGSHETAASKGLCEATGNFTCAESAVELSKNECRITGEV